MRGPQIAPVLVLGLVLSLAGCTGRPSPGSREVTVLAAASLTDVLTEVAAAYEDATPGVQVRLAFDGSQRLASQVIDGAPADVFASADATQMARVVDAGLVEDAPATFAHNDLVIAVAPGNPHGIDEVADLRAPDLDVVLAADEVPAGAYTARALARAGVDLMPVSRETSVRAVAARVAMGEADAGIVYHSDVVAADGEVEGVDIPPSSNAPVAYEIAALRDAADPDGAAAFVDFVQSQDAQRLFPPHGLQAATS